MSEYTAVSFAPVQSFIEKSRKLRDLYGASLILSFLSYKLVQEALCLGLEVISPGLPTDQKGMPNRILIRGKFERNDVQKTLLKEWQQVLNICRVWLEENLGLETYSWSQPEDQKGKQKGEWERWGSYTWEVFWGYGESVKAAMEDLETRKLKRDWIAINWVGESSSLTGTDAIAWHQLGKESKEPGRSLNETEQRELKRFYYQLAWILDKPYSRNHRVRESIPSDEELEKYFQNEDNGKFIAPNEKLSIPELVKRLVTLPYLARKIVIEELDEGFKDIFRDAGYWTGWFMGDGDKVGDKLKELASRHEDDQEKQEHELKRFTELIRQWGKDFQAKQDLFPEGKGRVIYAGGDDFLGVLYSEETKTQEKPEKVKPIEALQWLLTLENRWKDLQKDIEQELGLDFTYSVGFVWAGHQVPQRDILQHCRDAEQRAKSLERNRVTIRVVFNSGQYVEWTCPWDYLHILKNYRDRDGKTYSEWECQGQDSKYLPNWNHIYSDWAHLKARHAIPLKDKSGNVDDRIALALFDLYFGERAELLQRTCNDSGKSVIDEKTLIEWIDGLINIGWQLCSNS
ncbi:MAG: CRISPR-associated protein Cmr2 [Symplocastrum torsivum CPER-KK1]|jgi:CRISPR-associated protein Cmr2|uniref:CRISPR-associated protein Cmr2 n=1 Tax=Symplocastrum torsivum CPER-KK1 TaxID=450513 RepID=A0A951UF22_9CYAN|nr:CRISPR-associated protein Cmr2 [Symplocastrum torsivum CPER-KK1]